MHSVLMRNEMPLQCTSESENVCVCILNLSSFIFVHVFHASFIEMIYFIALDRDRFVSSVRSIVNSSRSSSSMPSASPPPPSPAHAMALLWRAGLELQLPSVRRWRLSRSPSLRSATHADISHSHTSYPDFWFSLLASSRSSSPHTLRTTSFAPTPCALRPRLPLLLSICPGS